MPRLRPEEGTDFVEDATEACRGGEGFEPTHGPRALFDAPVILFQMVVKMAVGPVCRPSSEDVANGPRIGIVAIGGDPVRDSPGYYPGGAEEGLSRHEIAGVAEPHIDQGAVPINRPVEIAPLSLPSDVGLVDVPAVSNGTTALFAQGLRQLRGQLRLPVTYGFMRKDDAAVEKHLREVP
jgi:hypothetical protein